MFAGGEVQSGNTEPKERTLLMKTLRAFSGLVRDEAKSLALGPGQLPFVRAANFLVVLNSEQIHLVIDDISVGGMPHHVYYKQPEGIPVDSLATILGLSVSEHGFRSPIGVSLPRVAYTEDEVQRESALRPIASRVLVELRERLVIAKIGLPAGFEHYVRLLPRFVQDHPDIDRNVFLMMRFRDAGQYNEIHQVIRGRLGAYGLNVLRADDKDYTGDLWENVCLYMLGCRYGVVVFEEIDQREFNPNVSLELGFMIALGKRCLLLKEQRMKSLPTDVVGKLYKEFDSYKIATTMTVALDSWASRDLGLSLASQPL